MEVGFTTYWARAIRNICESCVRKRFANRWYGLASDQTQSEVSDIVENIMGEDCIWASLFHDPYFANMIQGQVKSLEAFGNVFPVPCTCASLKVTTNPHKIAVHKVESMATVLNCQLSSSNQKLLDDITEAYNNVSKTHKRTLLSTHPKLFTSQLGVPNDTSLISQSPQRNLDKELQEAFKNISPIVKRSSPQNSNTCQLGLVGVHNDSRYSIFSNIIVVDPDYDALISLTYSIFSNISVHVPDNDSLISLS